VSRYRYFRQLDDGRWGEAVVDFAFCPEAGEEIGEVVDFVIHDEMPQMDTSCLVYEAAKQ
jgi:hypothetical protein